LHFAADAGKLEIVKILIAEAVTLHELTNPFDLISQCLSCFHSTARYWAAINRDRAVANILVTHGALNCDQKYEMVMEHLE
jgi:hypothetical protein